MFFNPYLIIPKLEQKIAILSGHLTTLQSANERLQKQLAQSEAKLAGAIDRETTRSQSITSFAFDFEAVNAFSIERLQKNSDCWRTVIGWIDTNDGKATTHEWNYQCNQETHEELVKQFQAYIAAKREKQND